MKNLKKRSILIFAFLALCLNPFTAELSAREAGSGKLIAGAVPDSGKFERDVEIDFSTVDALSDEERIELVVGRISDEKAEEIGNRRKYLKLRGKAQLAGKGFEELTVRSVQKKLPPGLRLESTAILGSPHDPADLILTKNGKVVERFQLKMGERTTYAALSNPKYAGQKILTPPDTLRKLQKKLDSGEYSPKKAEILRTAIAEGRLTDSVEGIQAPTSRKISRWTQKQLTAQWRRNFDSKRLPKSKGKLIAGAVPDSEKFGRDDEIDFSAVDALSDEERIELVVGRISEEKAEEIGNRRKYRELRGKAQLAGKGFEELTIRSVQKKLPPGLRLESTAILGSPHDPADLILTKNGKVVERFQLKMGERTTYAALSNPKYAGQKILTPPDTLRKLQKKLDSGEYSPKKAEILRTAIAEGRLTDSVEGIQAPTSRKISRWTQKQLTAQWRRNFDSKRLPKSNLFPDFPGGSSLRGGKVLFVKSLAVLDGLAKPFAVFDVIRGGQVIYSTRSEYYAGNLDRDLAQLKLLLGSVQMAVGTVRLFIELVPNPITKALDCVVGIVTFGVEAALWIVDKIQERRSRNQHEMICRLTEDERPGMLRELILRELKTALPVPNAG